MVARTFASPLRLVLMLACAALGALLADVEWLRSTGTSISTGTFHACSRDNKSNSTSTDRPAAGAATTASSPLVPPSRIHYWHVHGRSYRQRYGMRYACEPHPPEVRPLPHELQGPGIVNFQTDIRTSLKIAGVGDSIGVQIGHRLEEAMQPSHDEGSAQYSRTVYVETNWNNLVVSSPVRGGGALLSYRVNGLLWDEMQGTRRQRHRQRNLQSYFKPQRFNRSEVEVALHRPTVPLGNVDVMVQRITYPWIPLARITPEALEKNTLLASDMFGMETLVYVNFYFTNNVVNADAYRLLLEKQEVVRNFTRTYVPPSRSTLKRLLLLDLDRLVDLLNDRNARSIGIDTTNEPFERWMLSQTLGPYDPKAVFRKHVAQVCGSAIPNHTTSCDRNMIFVDGLHFCPSTFSGRITGGIACLIECAEIDKANQLRQDEEEEVQGGPDTFLRKCERTCNDKYMSLDPIPMAEMIQWNGSTEVGVP